MISLHEYFLNMVSRPLFAEEIFGLVDFRRHVRASSPIGMVQYHHLGQFGYLKRVSFRKLPVCELL